MSNEVANQISVDQLRVGVYVYLDVGWMHHPFNFNNFKIRTEEQLATIQGLGLGLVRWDPARSDIKPLAKSEISGAAAVPQVPTQESEAAKAELARLMAVKEERIRKQAEHRQKIEKVERAFANAAAVIKGVNKSIYAQPQQAMADTAQLIAGMVDELLGAPDLAIQVMADKPGNEDVYLHSLNVSVLAMVLGKEMNMPAELIKLVGSASIFHDIGLNDVPDRILHATGPLTKAEREFRELHTQYGFDLARKIGLPVSVANIVAQHHELYDGSGYPKRLKGDAIDPLARLVCVINAYDNLCNPVQVANAMTPHMALSSMFAQQRSQFDVRFLQAFIKFMGVYPPGTLVGLSNDAIGLVVRVNSKRPLRPTVIVYDAGVPKSEAMMLDLDEEPDINITKAYKPSQLPQSVYEYLAPRKRVNYYFDAGAGA
ncbi:HD-GYP domain-containing protein [Roseateles koreensis]|uniref:HD-GYP domain-containing protein n=1 Tax=Roseateles koreensis TaxID=2987526 RepID=A0ABT5KSP5_9BURK|nr:HD-GYP domain-containing protein [Roseateles koreensis]MDC8785954.1 HD-GYP domain-containing protein [Roseateles koreensis]